MASNPDSADALQCASHVRTAVSPLSRQLRSGAAAPDGPSVAKLSVLGQLHRHGPCTPTALAGHERVKLQSLTRLLAELEAEGWIGRAPHASDGRQWLLSLTPEGLRRLKALMRSREAALARAIGATLSAEQRALLLQACGLLDRIAGALEGGGEPSTGAARPR